MKIKMRTSTQTHTHPLTHTRTPRDRQPLDSDSVSGVTWPSGRPQPVSSVGTRTMPVARRRRCHVSQSTNQATNQAACDMQLRRACPACSTRRASVPDDEGAWQGGGERRGGDSACHHNFQLVCSQPWCSRLVSLTSTWPHLNLSLSCCSLNSNNPPPHHLSSCWRHVNAFII